MIYFAQLSTGAIKIGKADDVNARLNQLEVHFQSAVVLLATLPGGYKEEREIHQRFDRLRLGRTEQFRPGKALLEFIGQPLMDHVDPEAVEALPSRYHGLLAVPVDGVLVRKAKIVAKHRGISLTRLIGDIAGETINRDWERIIRRIVKEDKEEVRTP